MLLCMLFRLIFDLLMPTCAFVGTHEVSAPKMYEVISWICFHSYGSGSKPRTLKKVRFCPQEKEPKVLTHISVRWPFKAQVTERK